MFAIIVLLITAIVLNEEAMAERGTPESFDFQYPELFEDAFQNEEKLKRKYKGGDWDEKATPDPCDDDTRRILNKKAVSTLETVCKETNRGVLANLCDQWRHNLYDKYLAEKIPNYQ